MTGPIDARHLRGPAAVTPADAGWTYSGLRLVTLAPGERRQLDTGEEEMLVLPLAGACTVEVETEEGAESFRVEGRDSVFTRVSDFVYAPRDARLTVASERGGRFALPSARCERRLPARYAKAEDVAVELRGAGSCSRQVNNIASADGFACDRMIVVEVLTPAGNWSSYPPHKHDEDRPGEESVLEEIYYFQTRRERSEPVGSRKGQPAEGGPSSSPAEGGGEGMAYQRVYGTADRPEDLLAEVRSGDVVTIPHGWHGPSMAVPGYDLYYLNVMAGPGERQWLICDDPAHGWIRETWADEPVDPRLPLATAASSPAPPREPPHEPKEER